jgi:outer membrane translocation and assembly module TamA
MKRIIFLVISFLLLQACASTSPYQPANSRGYGYSETQLSETQYRIDFKAWDVASGKAVNYAMLRAAELTLEKGYDWFETVDRQREIVKPRPTTTLVFGVSSMRSAHLGTGLGFGMDMGGNDRNESEVLLEIQMGKGVKPDTAQVYSARELVENLRKSLALPLPEATEETSNSLSNP